MIEYEEYEAPSGELIQMYKDGSTYYVSSSIADEVRWSLTFQVKADAKTEFERWRK